MHDNQTSEGNSVPEVSKQNHTEVKKEVKEEGREEVKEEVKEKGREEVEVEVKAGGKVVTEKVSLKDNPSSFFL